MSLLRILAIIGAMFGLAGANRRAAADAALPGAVSGGLDQPAAVSPDLPRDHAASAKAGFAPPVPLFAIFDAAKVPPPVAGLAARTPLVPLAPDRYGYGLLTSGLSPPALG